mmetsp:Transcript_117843/g.375677  ORF Transcript_117843/g.375677 Transcript_117843/m.375677 type:complete len:213 (-) Transcript_117843:1038-1676(-)
MHNGGERAALGPWHGAVDAALAPQGLAIRFCNRPLLAFSILHRQTFPFRALLKLDRDLVQVVGDLLIQLNLQSLDVSPEFCHLLIGSVSIPLGSFHLCLAICKHALMFLLTGLVPANLRLQRRVPLGNAAVIRQPALLGEQLVAPSFVQLHLLHDGALLFQLLLQRGPLLSHGLPGCGQLGLDAHQVCASLCQKLLARRRALLFVFQLQAQA